jgi:AcrR family transcriptional regulator
MTIPLIEPEAASGRCGWTGLDAAGKREHLLAAAAGVFARDGLDAPMSVVADAAGAGVASVYRVFESKRELLAALVVRRLDAVAAAAQEAQQRPGERWPALTGMLRTLVNTQRADYLIGEARAAVADHPDVMAAADRASEAQERLMAAAREEGRLRADATALDLRLLFAATRAARQVEPEQWPRMLELMIDALDGDRNSAGRCGAHRRGAGQRAAGQRAAGER